MIYTVTFNPSLDYVVRVLDLKFNNLNRAESEELNIGGKGINVSTVLKFLGIESIALGFAAGFIGDEIITRLKNLNISSDFIMLDQGFSRINIKIQSDENIETVLNGQGPKIDEKYLNIFKEKLNRIGEGDILVLSGSVPKCMDNKNEAYSWICSLVKERNIKVIVDAEGELLMNTLSYRPFLIKPNLMELGRLFNQELLKEENIIYCAECLQREGAINVLVSMGERGALFIDEYGRIIRQTAPKGQVKCSVGAGDSMIAGFLAGLLKVNRKNKQRYDLKDYQYALKLGVAAGSAAAFEIGMPDKKMIESTYKQINK